MPSPKDNADPSVKEQLARLRLMTQMTGGIHEAQLHQLKLWPLVLFPCETHQLGHDSETRIVTCVIVPSGELPEDMEKRFKTFETWVHELLGDDWLLILKSKGKRGRAKELFVGERKAPVPGRALVDTEEGVNIVNDFRRYGRFDQAKAAKAIFGEEG
jgi:hypothetical protein